MTDFREQPVVTRRFNQRWLYAAITPALIVTVVIAIALVNLLQHAVGPWLDDIGVWARVVVGVIAGVALAAPLRLAALRTQLPKAAYWALGYYFTMVLILGITSVTYGKGNSHGSFDQRRAIDHYIAQADVFLPVCTVVFVVALWYFANAVVRARRGDDVSLRDLAIQRLIEDK